MLNSALIVFQKMAFLIWNNELFSAEHNNASFFVTTCLLFTAPIFIGYIFRALELQQRKVAFIAFGLDSQNEQASVLDQLPDGIIIASSSNIQYMNQEAWKILKCQASENATNIEDVVCLDIVNCSILTPLEQLINIMTQVDNRLVNIPKEVFLTTMITIAKDEAIMFQMASGLAQACEADEDNKLDMDQAGELLDQNAEQRKQQALKPGPNLEGMYYDIRIKSHKAGGLHQVIFVFTNANAEKELQRELVMKEYSQIMFASINHELRTPINGIQQSLACMKPFVDPMAKQYFQICESSSSFLLSLVNDTLDYAQLQAGKFKMNFEQVKIQDLVHEVSSLINVQLRLKENVYMVESFDPEVPTFIESDLQRLKQILINLLRNSTKFTFNGFIQLAVRKALLLMVSDTEVLATKRAVQFEVYDTGIGISQNNQENLFKLFGKVMQQNKQINKEGIGLGLYITKQLAEELGGVISVSSEENKYTKFCVTVPVHNHLNEENNVNLSESELLDTEKFQQLMKQDNVVMVASASDQEAGPRSGLRREEEKMDNNGSFDFSLNLEDKPKIIKLTNNFLKVKPSRTVQVSNRVSSFTVLDNKDCPTYASISNSSNSGLEGQKNSPVVVRREAAPLQELLLGRQTVDTNTTEIGTSRSISRSHQSNKSLPPPRARISELLPFKRVDMIQENSHEESSQEGGSFNQKQDEEHKSSFDQVESLQNSSASPRNEQDDSDGSESSYENECACKPLLVVDDNDFNLFTFKQVLKDKFNLEGLGAANGLEAVNLVKESLECCPFRAIFMDCSMPIMDGYEATRKINNMFEQFWKNQVEAQGLKIGDFFPGTTRKVVDVRNIPIAALTANDTVQERKRCLEAGMNVFLSKPPEPSELRRFVQGVFDKDGSN